MSQKSRLHRVAFPRFLAPDVVPFASVERVHIDGAVELIQPHARPIFVPVTHYTPAFTRRRADGTQLEIAIAQLEADSQARARRKEGVMITSPQIDQLTTALAKAQGAMTGATKASDTRFFRSRYADLASVRDACRGPLSDHRLSITQFPQTAYMVAGRFGVLANAMEQATHLRRTGGRGLDHVGGASFWIVTPGQLAHRRVAQAKGR
jgi:hypothetical protein